MPTRDTITAEEIVRRRRALGLSQPQFARAINTPLGTLRNWEQGRQGCACPGLLRYAFDCLEEHQKN